MSPLRLIDAVDVGMICDGFISAVTSYRKNMLRDQRHSELLLFFMCMD